MSDVNTKEVTAVVVSGAEAGVEGGVYGAEQARQYALESQAHEEAAKEAQNMAEAWAESDIAPAGEGTRSSKTWADVARQWAESDTEPDGVTDAKSSKTWASVSKDWANVASEKAAEAAASATAAANSEANAATSAATATEQAQNAATSASNAAGSAKAAADKYNALVNVDLPKKADLAGATFTGNVYFPTAEDGASNTQGATTEFVQKAINAMINGAPGTMDTFKEIADALGNDPNFASTIIELLAGKLAVDGTAVKAVADENGNNIATTYATKDDLSGNVAALAKVASTGSYNDLLDKPAIPTKTSELTNDSNYVATDADGNVTLIGTLTATQVFNAVYNDYAEFFPRGEATEPGDIIAGDETSTKEQYVKATSASKCVVGVHTEEFAQIIGGMQTPEGKSVLAYNLPKYIPVSMAGRVHVKFYGVAEVGTKVVPSDIPGVGRAFQEGDDPDSVVGIVCEKNTLQNLRLVKIKVR